MFLGNNKEKLEIVFMDDDGTRGKHLMFVYNGQPTSVIPLMQSAELGKFILVLLNAYKYFGYDIEIIKEGLREHNL